MLKWKSLSLSQNTQRFTAPWARNFPTHRWNRHFNWQLSRRLSARRMNDTWNHKSAATFNIRSVISEIIVDLNLLKLMRHQSFPSRRAINENAFHFYGKFILPRLSMRGDVVKPKQAITEENKKTRHQQKASLKWLWRLSSNVSDYTRWKETLWLYVSMKWFYYVVNSESQAERMLRYQTLWEISW